MDHKVYANKISDDVHIDKPKKKKKRYILSSHVDPVYPTTQPRHAPVTMSQ